MGGIAIDQGEAHYDAHPVHPKRHFNTIIALWGVVLDISATGIVCKLSDGADIVAFTSCRLAV